MSVLVALLLAQAAAAEVDCSNTTVQSDLNWCAAQDFAEADADLNAQWAITSADMRRKDAGMTDHDRALRREDWPGHMATLLAAQRAWLTFRDNHCDSQGYRAWGGSMEPMIVSMCLANLTRQRTRQLQELIEQ